MLTRRSFLRGLGIGAAAAVAAPSLIVDFDPERALWVPGQRNYFFVQDKTIEQVGTIEEALERGLVAVYPDGSVREARIGEFGGFPKKLPHEEAVAAWIAQAEAGGGRVIENKAYTKHEIAHA